MGSISVSVDVGFSILYVVVVSKVSMSIERDPESRGISEAPFLWLVMSMWSL